ncbi:MAG: hypothetical protein ACF8XB_10895, partial [Planctomycetota bacterium JB042]
MTRMDRRTLAAAVVATAILGACRRAEPPPRVVDRVHDLVAMLDRAEIGDGSPYALRPIPTISPDDPRDRIAVLTVPAGTTLAWERLPTRGAARLTFGIGVTWPADRANDVPVTFAVAAGRDGGPEEEVFRRTVRPGDLPTPRLVAPVEVT